MERPKEENYRSSLEYSWHLDRYTDYLERKIILNGLLSSKPLCSCIDKCSSKKMNIIAKQNEAVNIKNNL